SLLITVVEVECLYFLFFFSSRRRHTRSKRDWSSDVCSSDLPSISKLHNAYNIEIDGYSGSKNSLIHHDVIELPNNNLLATMHEQIGRASCRERVKISEGAGQVKRKRK